MIERFLSPWSLSGMFNLFTFTSGARRQPVPLTLDPDSRASHWLSLKIQGSSCNKRQSFIFSPPIYRIKGCQHFWVRHRGLLILSLWRNPRPWSKASVFVLICPIVWWFSFHRHKLDFFREELYSGGASRHRPGEKQNSLRRSRVRVIFNKPAEVRGDRSTAQSQYNNWLQREECGGPLQPSRKTGLRGDWTQLRPLQQVIKPREHDPYPFSIYWQLQTLPTAPVTPPPANIPEPRQVG